jgi:hypothetical protein
LRLVEGGEIGGGEGLELGVGKGPDLGGGELARVGGREAFMLVTEMARTCVALRAPIWVVSSEEKFVAFRDPI